MHRGLSAEKRNERWLTGCRSALVRPAGVMAIYNEFYGFAEQPFNITPDPRFLFYSQRQLILVLEQTRASYLNLNYSIFE